jgi:hypothetical protein
MTSKQLQSLKAIILRVDPPDVRRPKGWREGLLEMLRSDATNIDYLVPRLRR